MADHIETNKQLAALAQIHAAIWHFHNGEFECAATLAGAAEGLLPATNEPHLFQVLQKHAAAVGLDFNEVINWLKHPREPDSILIGDFEVAIIIVRAISKFNTIYKTGSPAMRSFVKWTFDKRHLPLPENEKSE